MAKQNKYHLEIEIDRLTNSIVNTISGDSFPTDVHPASKGGLKNAAKKNGWLFNWAAEFKLTDRQVFKLTLPLLALPKPTSPLRLSPLFALRKPTVRRCCASCQQYQMFLPPQDYPAWAFTNNVTFRKILCIIHFYRSYGT